jgi:hypothetical protein
MRKHRALAAAAMAAFFLSSGAALAGSPPAKGLHYDEPLEPGAMPKERARIMGYGNANDPRAAAEKRRSLGGSHDADDTAKAKDQQPKEKKKPTRR